MPKSKQERARERRTDKRIVDAGLGRKKASDVLQEELVEEAFDWLERGGARRIWAVLKIVFFALALILIAAFLYIVEAAN